MKTMKEEAPSNAVTARRRKNKVHSIRGLFGGLPRGLPRQLLLPFLAVHLGGLVPPSSGPRRQALLQPSMPSVWLLMSYCGEHWRSTAKAGPLKKNSVGLQPHKTVGKNFL